MNLFEKISESVKLAQKSGEAERLAVLRLFVAQIKNREIEKRGSGSSEPLAEEEVLTVLQREAKKRKESIELFLKGGRKDLADKEEKELAMIYEFIPSPMSQEEVEKEVQGVLSGNSSREFNVLMKECMAKLKGRADGKMITEILKSKLSV